MILVLLGTQNKPFNRLLEAVEREIKKGKIKDKVVAQVGTTKFSSNVIETFDFKPKEEIGTLIDKAKIIITHAGVGTITECINKNKKIIVVPRLKKYKEHTNDHQLQITKEFDEKKYIIPLYNLRKLNEALDKTKKFKTKKYESNTDHFISCVKKYIDE